MELILKGSVELNQEQEKIGVVSVVFITEDKHAAEDKLSVLNATKDEETLYMLYSCPLDTDLTELKHYPSLEISKDDII